MDGSTDTVKKENIGLYGPFAAVGLSLVG